MALSPLDGGGLLEITDGFTTISYTASGLINLLSGFNGSNGQNLDPTYDYLSGNPSGVISVLERRFFTNAPGIANSNTVYTILSPIGANMVEKLHLESLYLESHPGIVPKPGTATIAAASLVLLLRRRPRGNSEAI